MLYHSFKQFHLIVDKLNATMVHKVLNCIGIWVLFLYSSSVLPLFSITLNSLVSILLHLSKIPTIETIGFLNHIFHGNVYFRLVSSKSAAEVFIVYKCLEIFKLIFVI